MTRGPRIEFNPTGELTRRSRESFSRAGWTFLHATAALLGDRLVAFVGWSGAGKSTCILELARQGWAVSDEPLFLRTGPKGVEAWVLGAAPRLCDPRGDSKRTHWVEGLLEGRFELALVCALRRDDHEGEPRLENCGPQECLRHLLENVLRFHAGGVRYAALRRVAWEVSQQIVDQGLVRALRGDRTAEEGCALSALLRRALIRNEL